MSINTDHLNRCIETLEKSITLIQNSEKGSIDYEIYRNAIVKGFELTLETSGKLLKKVLKQFFANPREVDALVFKDIFRYAAKHSLLATDEVERWFIYRDNRNTTAHDYGEGFAEQTLVLMPGFVTDARKLLESLRNAQY